MKKYDVTIIGAGPCGLTAAIYAARYGLSCAVLEEAFTGGQVSTTSEIENYPGFKKISGYELAERMSDQAKSFGAEIISAWVVSIKSADGGFTLSTTDGEIEARAVIAATGAKRRELGIDGEKRLSGSGVSYCATCDGNFYKKKTVMVVGGGNTALEDALYLSAICEKVCLVHRRDSFRASKAETDKLKSAPNIELVLDSVPEKISGRMKVESVAVKNVKSGQTREIACDAVFIAVGTVPVTGYLPEGVNLAEDGSILTDEKLSTSLPGLFAAGDVRFGSMKQIVTACADGALAAKYARDYLG